MRRLDKILLIDDDKVNNFINTCLLEEMNIATSINVETNGQRGLEHLLSHCRVGEKHSLCPELIIFDYDMPVMDGLEMIRQLHKLNFIQTHPVVFLLLGIHLKEAQIEEFQKLGVQEYTSKPLSTQTVMDVYHKYFSTNN